MKRYNGGKFLNMVKTAGITGGIVWGTSCTPVLESAAAGSAGKSVSGSGTLLIQKAGFNSNDKMPEFFNLMVWGDYTSLADEHEMLRYEELEDASIFNSNARTKHRKLFFASADPVRMEQMLETLQKHISNNKLAADHAASVRPDIGQQEKTDDSH